MLLADAVRKRIIKLAKERKITLNKLATLSGITYSTLNTFMLKETNNPTISTLLHICEGLNIELKEFFDDVVFRDVEGD
ncbi:MAG: helix-turn-helix domain-containing protein [Oscillospiraceae bacterium]|nr:helix-turn-helix domain-containing protein [Oscillospiraceae bacterium]